MHYLKIALISGALCLLLTSIEKAMGWHLGLAPFIAIGVLVGVLYPTDKD